jgi:hypothetical protein
MGKDIFVKVAVAGLSKKNWK